MASLRLALLQHRDSMSHSLQLGFLRSPASRSPTPDAPGRLAPTLAASTPAPPHRRLLPGSAAFDSRERCFLEMQIGVPSELYARRTSFDSPLRTVNHVDRRCLNLRILDVRGTQEKVHYRFFS